MMRGRACAATLDADVGSGGAIHGIEKSLSMLVMISALLGWIIFSVYTRAEFLKNRKRDFVEVARAMGASNSRLIFKHIWPNSLVPIITLSPFVIASYITGLASLDYLGLGLPPPTPSWGELLDQADTAETRGR